MRFNPEYWNRDLPIYSIQFLTFWDAHHSLKNKWQRQEKNYRLPPTFVNKMNWKEVAEIIEKITNNIITNWRKP